MTLEEVKAPKLRFPGFTDAWEQRKLVNCFKERTERCAEGELIAVTINSGVVKASDLNRNNNSSEDKSHYKVVKKNDIAYNTMRMWQGASGYSKYDGILSPAYTVAIPNSEIDSVFFSYMFKRNDLIHEFKINSQGLTSDTWNLKFQMFSNIKVNVPIYEEQKKIGQFFKSLDTLITLHQRKLEKLRGLKKAYLEKMFPKKGTLYPELRFSGFTDAWEQRKFGDVGSVAMCKRIFKEQTSSEGDVPFFKIGTFGGEPDAYIDRELFEEYKTKFSYPNKGDILVSASGTIGRTVEFTGADEYFQDSNIVWLKHTDVIENGFLKILYEIVKWNGVEGTTIRRLYNENFLTTEFMLPSVPEQKKIGAYFRSLDNLITLHQRKLDTLKKLKKGFLQKMFPKNGESVPEIRFPGFTDAWEQRKVLNEVNSIDTGKSKFEAKEY